GDPMVFTVSLSNPSATDVTVTLNTANGTAVAPGDYTAQTGVVVTILAGSTTATVNVPTVEDAIFEGNENFTATLSSPVGATLGTATGIATIAEDDVAPTLSINDVSASESAGTATFTVTLSGASATAVTVDYATANGTATAGSDYAAGSGTLTFAPGVTTQTISVVINDDATDEPDETYTLGLSNAVAATIADNSGLGTIVDDDIRVIDAVADAVSSVPGTGGRNVINVLANDTLDGAPINPADVVVTPTGNGPLTINADGSVDVAPNTPAGTYTATYQICEAANPANCDSATVSITVVAAAVVANDDTGSLASGAAGGTAVANVLGNDTVGGATATTSQVLLSQQSSSHANVTLDTATGAILVAPGTPAGTYTVTYQICEALNPSNCDTATVSITVAAAAIVANDDNIGPIPGSSGGSNVANVLANDTLGGASINPADVVVTPTGNGPLTINPDGSVDVSPNTPAGTYSASYQICERLNPSNCDSATVTITVAAAVIDAVDDNASATPVNGSVGGTALATVLANDSLGGAAATVGNVTLGFVSSTHANVTLDAATGAVRVAAGTPAGTYTLTYRICEQLNPANCDTAVATIAVSAAVIAANNDAAGPITGSSGGTNVANVLANDTLGGTPVDLVMVVFTPGSSGPLTINPDGSVDVAPDTPTGNYTATYQICERLNPTNCASASITVSVQGDPVALRLTMTAAQRTVRVGDLVRYTLRIDNIGETDAVQVELAGRLPEGFTLVANSLQVADDDTDGTLLNASPLRIGGLDIPVGRSATVIYVLRVGAGVGAGIHTNRAVVRDGLGAAISNEATADVEVAGDPMLDDSLIIGSVFNDANGNGRQDAGERGLPGVRLGTVEGLLIETDQYGRFHLVGIDGGRWARGRNFLIKVDASTLPPGSRFTTENPRVLRITPGVPVRFDFGVQVPGMPLGGGKTEVNIDLGQVLFEGRSATVPAEHLPVIDRIADRLREAKGGSVAITANADDMVLAFHRAEAVRDALDQRLSPELRQATRIELRAQVDGLDALVTLDKDIQLGELLFDTDKAAIKPQYRPLLAAIAERVQEMPNTVVAISGYADARGTAEHNLRLSQQRADAVAREISARLPAATRTCVRMEPRTPEQAATCPAGR
ncbi:MAG TPA: Calx-beta domain-containing protein, partial [Pseudoxanthomonas sp.]|nr:Calx-beta domain-containing protein [Pseudoxanthomonas sp.]